MGDRGSPVPLGKAGAGSLAEFEDLLASFDLLPKAEKKPFTTLLEIAKFPHSELACTANLLSHMRQKVGNAPSRPSQDTDKFLQVTRVDGSQRGIAMEPMNNSEKATTSRSGPQSRLNQNLPGL